MENKVKGKEYRINDTGKKSILFRYPVTLVRDL